MAASRSSSAKVRMFDIVMLHKAGYLFTNVEPTGFTQVLCTGWCFTFSFTRNVSDICILSFCWFCWVAFNHNLFLIYSTCLIACGFLVLRKVRTRSLSWSENLFPYLMWSTLSQIQQNELEKRTKHTDVPHIWSYLSYLEHVPSETPPSCHRPAIWKAQWLCLECQLKSPSFRLVFFIISKIFKSCENTENMKLGGHIREIFEFSKKRVFPPTASNEIADLWSCSKKVEELVHRRLAQNRTTHVRQCLWKICVRQDVTTKHPAVTVHTDSAYKEHMLEAQKKTILSMLKHIWSTSGLGFSQVHTKEASALEAAS